MPFQLEVEHFFRPLGRHFWRGKNTQRGSQLSCQKGFEKKIWAIYVSDTHYVQPSLEKIALLRAILNLNSYPSWIRSTPINRDDINQIQYFQFKVKMKSCGAS